MTGSAPLLPGTLDLLIFKALSLQPLHGLGVSRRIEQITQGSYRVGPGSLFPALHRLEQKGWLASSEGESENNRRAKFYRLTPAGQRQLRKEVEQWRRIVGVMQSALELENRRVQTRLLPPRLQVPLFVRPLSKLNYVRAVDEDTDLARVLADRVG